jgi:hypothetical protein
MGWVEGFGLRVVGGGLRVEGRGLRVIGAVGCSRMWLYVGNETADGPTRTGDRIRDRLDVPYFQTVRYRL